MTQPTILIAGATGTNGSALLAEFNKHRVPVRAMVRNADKAAHLASDYVELVEADLADPASLPAAFDGIRKAYIVTAIVEEVPVWFANFYAAAKAAGVELVVKFSGMTSSPDSPSTIIRQHYVSDKALMDSGLNYTIIRPNSFYQNMLWQAEPIKAIGQFFLPAKDGRQSFVDVRDLAEASFILLTQSGHENKVYNLTGPESLSMQDIAELLSAATAREITYVDVTPEQAVASMTEAGMPQWNADVIVELQQDFANNSAETVHDDLAQILRRKPRTFADFAEDFKTAFGG